MMARSIFVFMYSSLVDLLSAVIISSAQAFTTTLAEVAVLITGSRMLRSLRSPIQAVLFCISLFAVFSNSSGVEAFQITRNEEWGLNIVELGQDGMLPLGGAVNCGCYSGMLHFSINDESGITFDAGRISENYVNTWAQVSYNTLLPYNDFTQLGGTSPDSYITFILHYEFPSRSYARLGIYESRANSSNWTTFLVGYGPQPTGTYRVPEPSALLLLMLGFVFIGVRNLSGSKNHYSKRDPLCEHN